MAHTSIKGHCYNPITGHKCARLTYHNKHLHCHLSQEFPLEDAGIAAAMTVISLTTAILRGGKHGGLAAIFTLNLLIGVDLGYKIISEKGERVEEIDVLPLKVVQDYNELRINCEEHWHDIVHNKSLQNDMLANFSHLEEHCREVFHTDIMSPPPVLAILCHGIPYNAAIAGDLSTQTYEVPGG